MNREEFAQQMLGTVLDPRGLITAGAAVVFVAVAGAASLRILRRLPDFPAKRQMEWGARWCWLLFLLIIVIAYAAAYVCMTRTRYTVSSAFAGKLVVDTMLLSAMALLRPQINGYSVCFAALGQRIRGRAFDFTEWVRKTSRAEKRWTYRAFVATAAAIVILSNAYIVLAFTYAIDIEYSEWMDGEEHASAVARVVEGQLASPEVEGVQADGPIFDLDLEKVGELETAERSLRRILHVGATLGPTSSKAYRLFVHVRGETGKSMAAEMLEEVRRILKSSGERQPWIIWVGNRKTRMRVRGGYPDDESVAAELNPQGTGEEDDVAGDRATNDSL